MQKKKIQTNSTFVKNTDRFDLDPTEKGPAFGHGSHQPSTLENEPEATVSFDLQLKLLSNWSVTGFATTYYGKWITKAPFRMATLVIGACLTCAGVWGITKVSDGLDLTEIVPRDTSVYKFLQSQVSCFRSIAKFKD